jgi:polynucleotide 5'-kinase involved in rRNA processing
MKDGVQPDITPLNQIYFDSADPASDPDLYLRAVTSLVGQIPKKSAKIVVNTCGWVEGLGAFLLG